LLACPERAGLKLGWAIGIAAFLYGTPASGADHADAKNSYGRVTLDACVNWDYRHHKKLHAWKSTANILESTLRAWYPQMQVRARLENVSPARLKDFLGKLPGPKESDLSLVYLASRQSPAGAWEFPGGEIRSWAEILQNTTVSEHARRITILDSCFAASVRQHKRWEESLGSRCLYAAAGNELTWELNFRKRLPIDIKKRFPATSSFCENSLSRAWDGRLSSFGLVWVEAFLQTDAPPTSEENGAHFLAGVNR
jgi:hypothetical protein